MLDTVKNEIFQRLNELFAEAAVDNLAHDDEAYTEKLKQIAEIAKVLGIKTVITKTTINIIDF